MTDPCSNCGSVARKLKITEGVAGMWHYHLSNADDPSKALCGAHVMGTSLPLTAWMSWKHGAHIPKQMTYCKECDRQRKLR